MSKAPLRILLGEDPVPPNNAYPADHPLSGKTKTKRYLLECGHHIFADRMRRVVRKRCEDCLLPGRENLSLQEIQEWREAQEKKEQDATQDNRRTP